ncbi:MAG: NADH-quinone oxidoreductase subunit J [Acidimicrobiia bacterium]|nr:NADH-quinone oxidoreductase subunit J [Acidimicrobiia bacterium]
MGSEALLFWVFGLVTVVASLLVIAQRNPVYSVLLLIASFAGLSGLYVLLDAPFTAVTQIVVYAGAILVLFLFVVMLLNAPHEDTEEDIARLKTINAATARLRSGPLLFGALLAIVFVVELLWALRRITSAGRFDPDAADAVSSVSAIGRVLFTEYQFAFEVTSVLIIVAMVGAVVLARREPAGKKS